MELGTGIVQTRDDILVIHIQKWDKHNRLTQTVLMKMFGKL